MNKLYEIIVSSVGLTLSTYDNVAANQEFKECVQMSQTGYGRFAGESVTMFYNGSIVAHYDSDELGD